MFIFRVLNERGMYFLDHPELMRNAAFTKVKLNIGEEIVYTVRAQTF